MSRTALKTATAAMHTTKTHAVKSEKKQVPTKPKHRKLISTAKFKQYLEWVNRTGAADLIEDRLACEKGGRPRKLKTDVLLAAMMACFDRYGNVLLKNVHMVLDGELSRPFQAQLGIHPYGGKKLEYWQVTYLMAAIAATFDDPKNPKPTYETKDGIVTSAENKHRELEEFTTMLLSSGSKHIPATGSYAIDSTAIASSARPRRKGLAPFDSGAAHGYKTKTHDNPTKKVYGYHAHMMVRAGNIGGIKPPMLVDHISLTPANAAEAAPTLAMIDRAGTTAVPVSEVLIDRGFSFSQVENWAKPLHERGIAQVIDMHAQDKRVAVNADKGYIMIDGSPHCLHTPKSLHKLTRPPKREDSTPEEVTATQIFEEKLARRRQFALPVYERGTDKTRFQSLGAAGKTACSKCTHAYQTNTGKPAEKNKTITISITEQFKLRQTEYWGSPEWEESYGRRSRIEGVFGILKGATSGRLRRGWTLQLSITTVTVLMAIVMATMNLARLIDWARDNNNTTDPITLIDTASRGFVEVGAYVEVDEQTGTIRPIT